MAEVQVAPKYDKSKPIEKTRVKETCVLVTKDALTGKTLSVQEIGPNIVTDVGDTYYAQRGANGTVTYTFSAGRMVAARSYTITAAKTATFGRFVGLGSTYTGRTSFASGYPKANDTDVDNTGKGVDVVTYKSVYTTAQANYTVRAVGICRAGGATNSSGQLLSYKTLTVAQRVQKTSSITLTVYINHTFNGV
jgi:hypothetical protein